MRRHSRKHESLIYRLGPYILNETLPVMTVALDFLNNIWPKGRKQVDPRKVHFVSNRAGKNLGLKFF